MTESPQQSGYSQSLLDVVSASTNDAGSTAELSISRWCVTLYYYSREKAGILFAPAKIYTRENQTMTQFSSEREINTTKIRTLTLVHWSSKGRAEFTQIDWRLQQNALVPKLALFSFTLISIP